MGTDVTELFIVTTVIAVALIFDYTNGFHDSANAMAGPIATGALRPRTAVILGAVLNLLGACLSTAVAKTISGGFFDDELITASIILAGLVGAIVWNLMTWLFGLPSSSSHALFGGLIGAVIVGAGIASVNGWVIVSRSCYPPSSRHWSPASLLTGPRGWLIASPEGRRVCTPRLGSSMDRRSLHQWSRSPTEHLTVRRQWA